MFSGTEWASKFDPDKANTSNDYASQQKCMTIQSQSVGHYKRNHDTKQAYMTTNSKHMGQLHEWA